MFKATQPGIRFLASVRNVSEAQCAATHGADIIDCKEPRDGALGALDAATISAIRLAVPTSIPVSATIGDDAQCACDLTQRVANAATAGADFVKIGFDSQAPWQTAFDALADENFNTGQLVCVLLGDRGIDLTMVRACAKAGFAGVLLDTANKTSGALPDLISTSLLTAFVKSAHDEGLFVGLAGALRSHHVAELAALKPDILGFRGALCHNNGRQNELDPRALTALRATIDATQTTQQPPATSFEAPTL